jgi:hypothetical protein
MSRIEDFEIENQLIHANNQGYDQETSIHYAANTVHVSEERVREVYDFLFNLQNNLERRLNISI